jgi:hypothetical protein
MDVKTIGKIPDRGRSKAYGRKMGPTGAKRRAWIGDDYVHSSPTTPNEQKHLRHGSSPTAHSTTPHGTRRLGWDSNTKPAL